MVIGKLASIDNMLLLQRSKLICHRLGNELTLLARRTDTELRMLPSVVILGAQKAGTSSLFHYLSQHPQVCPSIKKEIHYFDLNLTKGPNWYQAHFPRRSDLSEKQITLDASPYYLFHPAVPERLKAMLPKAKFIVLLRDPVDRAYSHYWHEVRRGRERLPLPAAFEAEDIRLRGEAERLRADTHYRSFAHQHYSYISRGLYAQQIKRWFESFDPTQFLFLKSEKFFADPDTETNRAFTFIGLPARSIYHQPFNSGQYYPMDQSLRRALNEYYRPFNRELAKLLGPDFSW